MLESSDAGGSSCCPPLLAAESTEGICLCRRADLVGVKDSQDVPGVMDGPLFIPPETSSLAWSSRSSSCEITAESERLSAAQ